MHFTGQEIFDAITQVLYIIQLHAMYAYLKDSKSTKLQAAMYRVYEQFQTAQT